MVGGPVGAGMRVAPAPERGRGTATPVAALGVGAFATGTDLFVGSDSHAASVDLARKKAADAGVGDRVSFEVACAQTFSGSDHDLVTMFDCLHDMGDPVSAARRVREALAPDGTWLLVEPFAGDAVEDNLNPVGRLYYNGSTFLCVPNALSQPGGYALGAQAGEAAIRQVAAEAGFTRFRRATQTPFNVVYEIRP
jgi:ubiquinone/menaquinone biosynthesis C-methylase UbiE